MSEIEKERLLKIQQILDYSFNDIHLLIQALTTPRFGHEKDMPHYEILETLGDAVLKLIFILKKYEEGIREPGEVTKVKQCLENDATLKQIAQKYFSLENFIFISKNQRIKGTRILADIFEALCGALYLDSGKSLGIVEQKIVDRFYSDWDRLIEGTSVFNKNQLLEFLQEILKFTPKIKADFVKTGPDNAPFWMAKNPQIVDPNGKIIISLSKKLKRIKSRAAKTKKEAEKDLYLKIFNRLRSKK